MRWYGCRSSGGRIRSTKSRLRKDQTEGGRQRRQRANRGVKAVKRMSKLAEADTLLRQHKPHPELSHSLSSASHHPALHLLPCCQLFVSLSTFFRCLTGNFPITFVWLATFSTTSLRYRANRGTLLSIFDGRSREEVLERTTRQSLQDRRLLHTSSRDSTRADFISAFLKLYTITQEQASGFRRGPGEDLD